MTHRKVILFPFSIHSPYFQGYAWAAELAFRMNAKLQLFTDFSDAEHSPNLLYTSLLEAHGYYLQHYQKDEPLSPDLFKDPKVVRGELKIELLAYLKTRQSDIVIIDMAFSHLYGKELKEIINQSEGTIVLSPNPALENKEPITDQFFDQLRHAELYKLPGNFFETLGNDKSVFNYLRKIIQTHRQ